MHARNIAILLFALGTAAPLHAQESVIIWEEAANTGLRLWGRAEYLLWWTKGQNVPPLVTTGPIDVNNPGDRPGEIGQPATQVLMGGESIRQDPSSGGRFTLGAQGPGGIGLEGSYLFLSQQSTRASLSSPGTPGSLPLTLPFFNPVTGLEDSTGIAIPAGAGFSGTASLSLSTELHSAEMNGLVNLVDRPNFRLSFLAGYRYLALDENLVFSTVSQNVPPLAPDVFQTRDAFSTQNDFHGGQIGARAEIRRGAWSLEATGKIAFGNMHQATSIRGSLDTNDFNGLGPVQTFPGGYFTQPTNIGDFSRDRFAVVPEATLQVGWQARSWLKLFAGYTFLYASSVARPGNQIDRVINPSQGPAFTGNPAGVLVGPERPTFLGRDTDFWSQGLNFGFEVNY